MLDYLSPNSKKPEIDSPEKIESSIAAPLEEVFEAVQEPAYVNPAEQPIVANLSPVVQEPPQTARTDMVQISEVPGHPDMKLALADLFMLWGVIFNNQEDHPCSLALSMELKCFTNTGSLEDLAKLDRPAVISIRQQWVTLSKFGEGVATLITGNREFEVSAQALARNWNGNYTIFWRTPPGYERPLALGDVDESVDWLANQLALVESSPPVLINEHEFNVALEDRLKQFQMSVSIIPDGVAGVRTWIHVNSILGNGIPILQPEEG
jgi:general secretion pathway protein A